MIWFSSDTHFGHANIIRYCNRPFKSVEQMDETIIRNWNERVKPEDTVYFLGDFCFSHSTEAPNNKKNKSAYQYYRERLNGNIIHIAGNHDERNHIPSKILSCTIKIGGKFLYLVHEPERANPNCEINLHGHIHQNGKIQEKQIGVYNTILVNVGVDVWNFRPIQYSEIISAVIKFRKGLTSTK